MNPKVYNASLLIGVGMVGTGAALISVPAALVAVGALVIGLTLFGAWVARQ
ncbi:hypothetical protein [uncultured Ralstonia sp.]|jgi:hypothetical protein|uniref:hypothetical protein n=1 Tax=Ralstonia sp. TaxID=54061 RepID=UPI001EAC98E5|nr:hypothetical protein [uncultured Ralstonia sp.]UCF25452.1 MAG: hypothetical protein JSV72_08720 [Ralstonia sp.]